VGHGDAPLGFPPWEVLSWRNRFDHPEKIFRTLYCAEQRRTALREVLADFRPNAKAHAEYRDHYGEDLPAPRVTLAWREGKVLAQGTVKVLKGVLVDIDDPALRHQFAQLHADLLAHYGIDHLDIAQIRSKDRAITQALTRFVADREAAGILYGSNLDDLPCVALFEGKSLLIPIPGSKPEPLTASHPDLATICGEFGLLLEED
jgi:RES domain